MIGNKICGVIEPLPFSPLMRRILTFTIIVAAWCLVNPTFAAEWPPSLDPTNTTVKATNGRTIERFIHGPREAWGYPESASGEWGTPPDKETGVAQQNHNSFYVVAPLNPRENAPLCVVLHSANRTAYDYLGYSSLNRQIDGREVPSTVMTHSPDDFYALYLNSTNSEWWGWSQAKQNLAKQINTAPPAELRVLETIEWVAQKYHVDRNRIYLCGVSMGGCGTLGIGMPNGNIFAAIRANVPAGTNYASARMGGFAPSPSVEATQAERDAWMKRAAGVGLPDPPIIVDFSSQQDNWAMTQPALVQAAQAGRLPLVLCWGPFGHTTFSPPVEQLPYGAVSLAYPWLEIRKDEAYPVFTRASTDQQSPWLNAPSEFSGNGQMNAWFRWKSQQDTPEQFALQLWIAHPTVANPPPMPETATTDVTLRRLQKFKVQAGQNYAWKISRDGQVLASGETTPEALNGLLTLRGVALGVKPVELSVKVAVK